jgi:hypothetical protein
MKRNLIFIFITVLYLTLMSCCYNDINIISLTNMLLMTLMYIAFFIAVYLIDDEKIKK